MQEKNRLTMNNNKIANAVLFERGDYQVTIGEHEDFKQDVYLVTNSITCVVEYATPVRPQAISAAIQFQEHMDELDEEINKVKLEVVDKVH